MFGGETTPVDDGKTDAEEVPLGSPSGAPEQLPEAELEPSIVKKTHLCILLSMVTPRSKENGY